LICDEAALLRKQEYPAYPYLEVGSEILEEEGLLTETLTVMNRELSSYDAKAVAFISTYVNGVAEYIFSEIRRRLRSVCPRMVFWKDTPGQYACCIFI
jgi:hypothetical protein